MNSVNQLVAKVNVDTLCNNPHEILCHLLAENNKQIQIIKDQEIEIQSFKKKHSLLVAVSSNSISTISQLERARLTVEAKLKVLHAMPLISEIICGTFLGLNINNMHAFAVQTNWSFGRFCNGENHYSMNELMIFCKHPEWFPRLKGRSEIELDQFTCYILETLIEVDEKIISACLDLKLKKTNTLKSYIEAKGGISTLWDLKEQLRFACEENAK
jgi:hypothetical protein